MELVHDFTVPVPPDRAWDILTDVERFVPCMPGATVSSVDGDAFEGGMKLKLGPIGMTFKGQGSFVQRDSDSRTAVIEAKGRDAKGNGGAQAVVTAALTEKNGVTAVHVVTDLNVSGKAAQFGTGVMKDVSNRLLAQFADNLAAKIVAEEPSATLTSAPTAPTGTNGQARPSSSPSGPSGSPAPGPASAITDDAGLDLGSLIFGSESTRHAVKTVSAVLAGMAFGYLWGKNRVLERQARRG